MGDGSRTYWSGVPRRPTLVREASLKNFGSRTGMGVAGTAAAMSIAWAFLLPYGYPWPSVAWAILACAVLVAMAMKSVPQTPSVFDVITDVEAEPARIPVAVAARVAR
jgi:hypothetical protein